jgi:hypothetical protein
MTGENRIIQGKSFYSVTFPATRLTLTGLVSKSFEKRSESTLYIKVQFVTSLRTQRACIRNTNQLTLCSEVMAVCYENGLRHTTIFCGQKAEFLSIKSGGAYLPEG